MSKVKTSFGILHKRTARNRDCFYKVGDRVVLFPENPYTNINEYQYWKEIDAVNHKELCEFGTVIDLIDSYYLIGNNVPNGMQHRRTVIRFDDGRVESFSNLYYRLRGKILADTTI